MIYEKTVKYLDAYERGTKIGNGGFVKLEIVNDLVEMHIKINDLIFGDKQIRFLKIKGKGKERVLGETGICVEKGWIHLQGMAIDNLAEGIGYCDLEEIILSVGTNIELRCKIREGNEQKDEQKEQKSLAEKDFPIKKDLKPEEKNPEEVPNILAAQEEMSEERRDLEETCFGKEEKDKVERHQGFQIQENLSKSVTKWQHLSYIYPHVTPFGDQREYLKIKPSDFVILSKSYYGLCDNSFLLHGYYNYEHLILAREIVGGREHYYIGVPGNYYAKEKQVAVLFGFVSFEGKGEPARNGDFGYYMIPVEI